MSKEMKIEVITYEKERLDYFTDLMKKAYKKYNRLFKKFKDAPILSAYHEVVCNAGRESQFHCDVVEMLEKGYHKQEWISVDERLPEEPGTYVACRRDGYVGFAFFTGASFPTVVTHWMPLPEPPKMKGGAE
jgi:hypothetical protein